MVKEGSKPDPYAILSVGKSSQETTTLEKTLDPVFEETMHFLVRNPLTDTLLVRLMDRKTNVELGSFKQPLDAVYGRPEMTMRQQNFTLNTKSETKVNMSMSIKILKLGANPTGESYSMEEDHELDPENEGEGRSQSQGRSSSERDPLTSEPDGGLLKGQAQEVRSESASLEKSASSSSFPEERRPLLRTQESTTSVSSDPGGPEMRVRLTLRYSQTTQTLVVVVHSVANLPIEGKDGELPDPYVKLYILPERNKKQKTEARKDQTNPLYDERFEFPVIDLRGHTLEITVCDKKVFRSSPKIGDALISLDELQGGQALTKWWNLVP